MSDIFLVRHGQVSFGGDQYDALSALGERQAHEVGLALTQRGISPDRVATGSMNRHHETAQRAGRVAEWSTSVSVDPDWDEFDHVSVLAASGAVEASDRLLTGPDTLKHFFGVAIPRWSSQLHDGDYPETYGDFTDRVTGAFRRLCNELDAGETAVVYTSAGVIGRVVTSLLDAGQDQWLSLIPAAVNGGITRIVSSGDQAHLMSYNEHGHLSPGLVTQR